ncbi:MAG: metal-dependent transcriptional regulator [Candidatus Helarchaeales archaeon]
MTSKEIENLVRTIYFLAQNKYASMDDVKKFMKKDNQDMEKILNKLVRKKCILISPTGENVKLTDRGLEIAKRIYRKNEIFEFFLKKILKIENGHAREDAHRFEHVPSNDAENELLNLLEAKGVNIYDHLVPITFLKTGDVSIIRQINGEDDELKRLRDLGFLEGTPIFVVQESEGGGPIRISVRGSEYAFGAALATRILVQANPEIHLIKPKRKRKRKMKRRRRGRRGFRFQ